MMEMQKPGLLFEEFISNLHRQGFIIGVDHHLRLQELLNKLGPSCEPDGMKYLLCPIFAANEKQQQQFYRAFDIYFKPLETAADPAKKSQEVKPGKRETADSPDETVTGPKWQYTLLGILLVILAVVLINQWRGGLNKIEVNSNGNVTKITQIQPGNGNPEWVKKFELFLQENRYIFRWMCLLGPFIIFLLTEGYKYNRRRLIMVRQRGKKPPLVWPVKVETPEIGFIKNDWFYRAARFLRKRTKSDITCLDLDKTISETIARGGYPVFRNKSLTQPPEYLILIDLPNYRDHYAHLWDNLVTALAGEGVYVTRYFYEKDPRVCFKELDGQREYLSDINSRYSGHRLIICGDGQGLLDPLTGEMNRWTNLFQAWRERAILTPHRPREWGRREIILAGEFVLVPATLEGLYALEDHWEPPLELCFKTWKQADAKFPFLPLGAEEQVEELRKYLAKDTFLWLCACAVYPELHWDLTLYLGSLPCMPENLINEENILCLMRLPWFRTGAIPDEQRRELITRLDADKSRAIRTAIVELLEKNPAPTDSFAYDTYRLHLVVQRWMLSRKDRQTRKETIKSLKSIGEKNIVKDYTMLRFLEAAPATPLNFALPKRLYKIFYRKGIPFFGIRTGIRSFLTILIAIILFLFFKDPYVGFKTDHIIVLALTLLIIVVLYLFIKESNRDINASPHIQILEDFDPDVVEVVEIPLELRQEAEKARRLYKNEKGFWEADYGDGIIMVYIPRGEFTMGSDDYGEEKPMHKVYLTSYWMGKTEVTVKQYLQFVNDTQSHYPEWLEKGSKYNIDIVKKGYYKNFVSDENFPIVGISWEDARVYCNWLSNKTGLNFKLPTEAQWEKSARGIDDRKYPWGNWEPDDTLANFDNNISKTTPVGSYPGGASPYGLMDMGGNVWEWCSDWYGCEYYTSSPPNNPVGPENGSAHVLRGGSWNFSARYLRCATRNCYAPSDRNLVSGFRLCQETE